MSNIRDLVQELIEEYEAKMKANDLRIEELKKLHGTTDAIRGQLQAILDNEDTGSNVEVRDGLGNVIYATTRKFEYDDKDAMPTGDRFEHVVPHKGRPIIDRPQA